ncbi:MAG: sulfur carrier protein ThiS [Pseudomonadota bacterium]
MISIQFNQQSVKCKKHISLEQLLVQQGYSGDYFAVALNRHFIPKPNYRSVQIQEHDQVEIITAMQGG